MVMIMTLGKLGESGELQTYFDKLGVPFTFSGVEDTKVNILSLKNVLSLHLFRQPSTKMKLSKC